MGKVIRFFKGLTIIEWLIFASIVLIVLVVAANPQVTAYGRLQASLQECMELSTQDDIIHCRMKAKQTYALEMGGGY